MIHAAGLINDSIIQLKSREAVDQVLAPKVKGTLVLDAVLRDEKLDFFVLFSSVSAISGPAGQADYAAANAFLDAFAQQKAAKDGTYTVAIDWGVWREVGIVAEAAARVKSKRRRGFQAGGQRGQPTPCWGDASLIPRRESLLHRVDRSPLGAG